MTHLDFDGSQLRRESHESLPMTPDDTRDDPVNVPITSELDLHTFRPGDETTGSWGTTLVRLAPLEKS